MTNFIVDKDGWVTKIGSYPNSDHTEDEIQNGVDPEIIEPANPATVSKAWNWNGGNPKEMDTGNNIPPEPDEAKGLLLKQLKQWGWNRGKIRKLIKKYAVYEFIDGDNFKEAKLEIDDAEAANDIATSEAQTLKDHLDGKT